MPGKQDPEYFPLNVNLYDFESRTRSGSHTLVHHLHPGTFEALEVEDEEMAAAVSECIRSRSGSNTTRRTRNVSLNMTQNSDDEDEEAGSVQSDQSDIEEDMVDTLVLSIREKLRMDPNFSSSLWSASADSGSPPGSPYEVGNDSSGCHSSHSHLRRRRVHPYSNKTRHGLGSIQKKSGSGGKSAWWASTRLGKSNPDSPRRDDPYKLLQELIDSGSLIKEAVRRLSGPKRLGCSNPNPNISSTTGPAPPTINIPIPTSNSNQLLSLSPPSSRFTAYRDENSENTFPLSAQ